LYDEVNTCRCGWVKLDYLSWWSKGTQVPALVTTSPLGTAQADAGILPESATTTILFGNRHYDDDRRNGGRINFGYWLFPGQILGIEGYYWQMQEANSNFNASSTFSDGTQPGDIILARPFFNVNTGSQDASLIAFPNFDLNGNIVNLDGTVQARTSTDVQSAGAMLRRLLWIDFTAQYKLDVIGGYRFFRLNDSVLINDVFNTSGGVLAPTTFESTDRFLADNQFHGGDIGLSAQVFCRRLSLEMMGKMGIGSNRQNVNISGSNSITSGGLTTTTPGGLLTQPTNIGSFSRDRFAVLPEAAINVRWDVTRNLRAQVGYTFLYLDRVVRSAQQIDLGVNPTQLSGGTLAGEPRPAFAFQESNFWVQGVNAGIEYRW
jgi:hypothetical protein